jgi:competence protein ComFC
LELLNPEIRRKEGVYSFYDYEEIEFLLEYKYEKFGDRVINLIAQKSFSVFAKEFLKQGYDEKIYVIPVDDDIKKGFSHTAILARSMKNEIFKPIYGVLRGKNVKYAGKSLEYRLSHPRDFKYFGRKNVKAVLVDDVKTTGITLNSAVKTLEKNGVEVLFCLVLSDKSYR